MTSQTRTEVAELLARHGLSPRKALGQHFLADRNIVAKIVAAAEAGPGVQVVEIGPGTGTLTRALAASGAKVIAYEVDEALEPLLREVLAGTDVDLRFADATGVDFDAELPEGEWRVVSNLPYNVGTPIVLDVLRTVERVTSMVVMVQDEVADRLVASPGSKVYGLPSVIAQLHAEVTTLFRVPPQVFVPPPQVGSAVVSLRRRPAPPGAVAAIDLATAAFNQRRKMLRRSLAAVVEHPGEVFERAGIPGTARAEELSPLDFVTLAEAWRG